MGSSPMPSAYVSPCAASTCVAQLPSGSPVTAARFCFLSGGFKQIDTGLMRDGWHQYGNLSGKLGTHIGTISLRFGRAEGASFLGSVGSCPGDLAAILPAIPTPHFQTRADWWPNVALVAENRKTTPTGPTRGKRRGQRGNAHEDEQLLDAKWRTG